MDTVSFSLSQLEETSALLHSLAPPTPQYCWPLLCQRTGTEVWVKHENHTAIGTFKVRGGLAFLDDLKRSQTAGKVISHASTTRIADGVACRQPDELAFAMVFKNAERIVQVTDDEVEAAMRAYFTDTHNVAEGAGALGLAALLQEREKMRGRKVGIVLTGGNVDLDVFSRVLEGQNLSKI